MHARLSACICPSYIMVSEFSVKGVAHEYAVT